MDVDAANVTQFKKLTPEEQAQLAKEGQCFRCHLQGHMACNCPKNTNYNNNPTVHTNGATAPTKESTLAPTRSIPPSTPAKATTKLSCAQQICAIKETMMDEEQSKYLDAHDMGQEFWSAGA
jgi:hypothetical protein